MPKPMKSTPMTMNIDIVEIKLGTGRQAGMRYC